MTIEQNQQSYEFDRCTDDVIIHILQSEMRGLHLLKKIAELCRDKYEDSVYAELTRLELSGKITSRKDQSKKFKLFRAKRDDGTKSPQTSQEISDFRDFGFAF
jgi:hypothetical protein